MFELRSRVIIDPAIRNGTKEPRKTRALGQRNKVAVSVSLWVLRCFGRYVSGLCVLPLPVTKEPFDAPAGQDVVLRVDKTYLSLYGIFEAIAGPIVSVQFNRSAMTSLGPVVTPPGRSVNTAEVNPIRLAALIRVAISAQELLGSDLGVDSAIRVGCHQRYGSTGKGTGDGTRLKLLDLPAEIVRISASIRYDPELSLKRISPAMQSLTRNNLAMRIQTFGTDPPKAMDSGQFP